MITPLHIVAALPVKFWYPKQFSLIWFSITNVLDCHCMLMVLNL